MNSIEYKLQPWFLDRTSHFIKNYLHINPTIAKAVIDIRDQRRRVSCPFHRKSHLKCICDPNDQSQMIRNSLDLNPKTYSYRARKTACIAHRKKHTKCDCDTKNAPSLEAESTVGTPIDIEIEKLKNTFISFKPPVEPIDNNKILNF
jgi:hypothetical protein